MQLLLAYRAAQHPATGLTPGEILFSYGDRESYPQRKKWNGNEFDSPVQNIMEGKPDVMKSTHQSN